MKDEAIIFDLDGTAIDSPEQKHPTDRLIKAIELVKEKYYLCAATGRVWSFAKPILKGLNLTDPCIISAGTQICDPVTGKILWQKNVPEEAVNEVLAIFRKETPDNKLLYNDGTEDDYFNGGTLPEEFSVDEPVYFLEQTFVPDDLAVNIHQKLSQVHGIACVMVVAQKPGTRDIHIINKSATKEHAVMELLNMLDIQKEHTTGIGDGPNDLHLFNAVNTKIAMANAVPELKKAADQIIGEVKEDGMAKFLETLL
jgi:Cof subfamily protein (haloacid dehalogenase superfamily)